MIKRTARYAAALSCAASGMLRKAEQEGLRRLTILCYHRVLPADAKDRYFIPDLVVTPRAFTRQCEILKKHYDVLPISEAYEALLGNEPRQKPLAAITFDDGYRDNLTYAAPILKDLGLRATFYVVTGLVDKSDAPWYDKMGAAVEALASQGKAEVVCREFGIPIVPHALAEHAVAKAKKFDPSKRAAFLAALLKASGNSMDVSPDDCIMSWAELEQLVKDGHEIGSHSETHEILPLLNEEALGREVAGSRETLRQHLGAEARTFCYPNGDYDDETIRSVRDAGFSTAVTVEEGRNGAVNEPFRLKRWFIHEDRLAGPLGGPSGALLRMEITGLADRFFARNLAGALRN